MEHMRSHSMRTTDRKGPSNQSLLQEIALFDEEKAERPHISLKELRAEWAEALLRLSRSEKNVDLILLITNVATANRTN